MTPIAAVVLAALLAGCGWAPIAAEGRMAETGAPVTVQHRLDSRLAEVMTLRLPDGRRYGGYFSVVNLLRPGETPPPPPKPSHPNATRFVPMPHHRVLRRAFLEEGGDGAMECDFRYDGTTPDGPSPHTGRADCLTSRGEIVTLRWRR